MAVREILLLGNPRLYEPSKMVSRATAGDCAAAARDLHDTLMDFRRRFGYGRAIAAPQIGVAKRLVVMHIDHLVVFLNPILEQKSSEMMDVWDDCMCFPDHLDWNEHVMSLEGDLSELLQHECDHLDGVLAVARARDGRSYALRSQRPLLGRGNKA
jgi:peptide deformylase